MRLAELEAELRESDRLIDDLFRTNPEAMWIVDRETLQFLEVNDAAVARYGYTREQFMQMTLLDVRPEEHHEEFWANHRRVDGSRWAHIGIVTHRRLDGSTFLVDPTIHELSYRGRPARLARLRLLSPDEVAERRLAVTSGLLVERLAAIVDVWRDLSERDLTVAELLAAVPEVAVGILAADGAILYQRTGDELVPTSCAGHLGHAPVLPLDGSLAGWVYHNREATRSEDYNHDPRAVIIHPRLEDSRALVAAAIPGTDDPVGVIVALDRRAGYFGEADERTLDLLARALGTLVRRVEVEAAHRAIDERLQLVVDATTDAIYDWQFDEQQIWWSPGAAELFGHPVDHLMESIDRWSELLHPDERRAVIADLRVALDDPSRGSWTSAYRFRRGDGDYVHIRDRARISRHADGRPWRIVGGMTDITDLVEAEARMLQSQRLEAVGQLTGGLAHDFNNLLTVVIGNADQLIDELPGGSDELVELAELVRAAALRGADLSRQLLAFARRQPLDPRPIDINEFVREVSRLLRRTIPESIQLDLLPGTDLPHAFADRGQLESALVNLCINSRDSMPDGGRLWIATGSARVAGELPSAATSDPWVVVSVGDTGSGIPPELLDRVVEPFFTTKTMGAGSGLGLSMVHGFVTQSGGHLELSSRPGRGTVARVYLPAAGEPAVDEPATHPVALLAADAPVARAGERILVVEDDLLVRELAVRQLTAMGYEVLDAGSGPEAIELLRSEVPVDLLFTDVVMPGGMDGRALAEAAVQLHPGLPVLFTSGYSRDAIVQDGRIAPGVHLLVKPYRAAELARRVRRVLDAGADRPPD